MALRFEHEFDTGGTCDLCKKLLPDGDRPVGIEDGKRIYMCFSCAREFPEYHAVAPLPPLPPGGGYVDVSQPGACLIPTPRPRTLKIDRYPLDQSETAKKKGGKNTKKLVGKPLAVEEVKPETLTETFPPPEEMEVLVYEKYTNDERLKLADQVKFLSGQGIPSEKIMEIMGLTQRTYERLMQLSKIQGNIRKYLQEGKINMMVALLILKYSESHRIGVNEWLEKAYTEGLSAAQLQKRFDEIFDFDNPILKQEQGETKMKKRLDAQDMLKCLVMFYGSFTKTAKHVAITQSQISGYLTRNPPVSMGPVVKARIQKDFDNLIEKKEFRALVETHTAKEGLQKKSEISPAEMAEKLLQYYGTSTKAVVYTGVPATSMHIWLRGAVPRKKNLKALEKAYHSLPEEFMEREVLHSRLVGRKFMKLLPKFSTARDFERSLGVGCGTVSTWKIHIQKGTFNPTTNNALRIEALYQQYFEKEPSEEAPVQVEDMVQAEAPVQVTESQKPQVKVEAPVQDVQTPVPTQSAGAQVSGFEAFMNMSVPKLQRMAFYREKLGDEQFMRMVKEGDLNF